MRPDGWNDGRAVTTTRLESRSQADAPAGELVFDFTGLEHPGLPDLALVLTARLRAGPGDRVWVTALPGESWRVLRLLGLDHLFEILPETSGASD